VCRYCGRTLADREVGRVVSDVVVAEHACRSQDRTDRVRTAGDHLTARTAVDGCHAIAREEACQCAGKGRINLTVGLTCWVRCDRSILFLDGEVSRVVGNVIVAENACRAKRGTDRVRAARDRLAARAAVGGRYAIPGQEASEGPGKGWISAAVSLASGVRCHGSVLLLDSKVRGVVSDVVVAEHTRRSQDPTNFVRTVRYRLTARAAVGHTHAVGCQESNQCASEGRIGTAISLAGGIGCDRSVLPVNRELSGVVSDVVVPEDTGGTQGRADRVRTTRYRFTSSAPIRGRDTIPRQEANEGTSKGRINVTVDLTCCVRCD